MPHMATCMSTNWRQPGQCTLDTCRHWNAVSAGQHVCHSQQGEIQLRSTSTIVNKEKFSCRAKHHLKGGFYMASASFKLTEATFHCNLSCHTRGRKVTNHDLSHMPLTQDRNPARPVSASHVSHISAHRHFYPPCHTCRINHRPHCSSITRCPLRPQLVMPLRSGQLLRPKHHRLVARRVSQDHLDTDLLVGHKNLLAKHRLSQRHHTCHDQSSSGLLHANCVK